MNTDPTKVLDERLNAQRQITIYEANRVHRHSRYGMIVIFIFLLIGVNEDVEKPGLGLEQKNVLIPLSFLFLVLALCLIIDFIKYREYRKAIYTRKGSNLTETNEATSPGEK